MSISASFPATPSGSTVRECRRGNLAGSFSYRLSGYGRMAHRWDWPKALIWFQSLRENLGPSAISAIPLFIQSGTSPDGKRVATMRGLVGSADIWLQEGHPHQPVHIRSGR